MKRIISVFLSICMLATSLLTLSSCAVSKKVSDKQLVKDLSANEAVTNIFKSELFKTEPFEYFSHRITKRQTNLEKKEDIIYCSLTVNNKNFSVTADCVLNYNFYDQGGWILDEIDISNHKAAPTGTFSNEEILSALAEPENKKVFHLKCMDGNEYSIDADANKAQITKSEIISENNSYIMRISLKYKSSLTLLEGCIDIPFDSEKGWIREDGHIYIRPTKIIESDYQKALGVFVGKKFFDTFVLYIDSINEEEGYAEFRMRSVDSYGISRWKKDGKVMKCPFDVCTGIIDASKEDIVYWNNIYIFDLPYNADSDSWDGLPRNDSIK